MSPSLSSSENKQIVLVKPNNRPPSHPGVANPQRKPEISSGLPPRQDPFSVKRVESYTFQSKPLDMKANESDERDRRYTS